MFAPRRSAHCRGGDHPRVRFDADDVSVSHRREDAQRPHGRRGDGTACPKTETRVMPGTAKSLAHERAIGERRSVVRTHRVQCKELVALAHEKDRVLADMTGDHSAFGQVAHRNALLQVRAGG
jgi:hypothetical protein